MARCDSSFDHSIEIRQKPKELIKLSVVLRGSRNKIRIVGRFEGGPEINRLIDGSLGVCQDSLGFHPAAGKRNMAFRLQIRPGIEARAANAVRRSVGASACAA